MSGSRTKPGPLKLFVEGYREWLLGRGYSPSVVIRSLITLFSRTGASRTQSASFRAAHRPRRNRDACRDFDFVREPESHA